MAVGEHITEDDITVTTATQSEAEVRAHFGVKDDEKVTPADGDKKTDEGKKAEPAAAVVDGEEEAPTANETAEQRAARESRNKTRGEKRVESFEQKIARLRREQGDLERDIDSKKKQLAAPAAAPVTTPTPGGEKKPDAKADERTFAFPKWEEWQKQPGNEDKDFEDYTDARTDARYTFNDTQARERDARARYVAQRQEEVTRFKSHEDAFRKDHADYDAVLAAVPLIEGPAVAVIQRLLAKQGDLAPAILYHLGQHPDDATRLMTAPSPEVLLEEFGALKHIVKAGLSTSPAGADKGGGTPAPDAATKPAPAAAAPSKPVSDAPAPVSQLPGGASPGRTLQHIAEEDDDADAYIEKRGHGHLLKR